MMDFRGLARLIERIKAETTLVTTCPIDGFPLEASPKGMWCPFCGWPFGNNIQGGDI